MGTHPIFESDFDCLTDFSKMTRKSRSRERKDRKIDVKTERRESTTGKTEKKSDKSDTNREPIEIHDADVLDLKAERSSITPEKERTVEKEKSRKEKPSNDSEKSLQKKKAEDV